MEDKRLQLEAMDRMRLYQAKRSRNRRSKKKQSQSRRKQQQREKSADTQTAANVLSTWQTMYKQRMKRGSALWAIPESLIDTGFKTLEQSLERAIVWLLSKLKK